MARYAPGLPPSELERMTPEEARYVRKAIVAELKAEGEERLAYVRVLVKAASARTI